MKKKKTSEHVFEKNSLSISSRDAINYDENNNIMLPEHPKLKKNSRPLNFNSSDHKPDIVNNNSKGSCNPGNYYILILCFLIKIELF